MITREYKNSRKYVKTVFFLGEFPLQGKKVIWLLYGEKFHLPTGKGLMQNDHSQRIAIKSGSEKVIIPVERFYPNCLDSCLIY